MMFKNKIVLVSCHISSPIVDSTHNQVDLQHAMCLEMMGTRLHLAPIEGKPLANVLDFATGECST